MPVVFIENLEDPRLAPYRNLKATNATRWQGTLIAEGEKLVRRAIEGGLEIRSLLVSERCLEAFRHLVLPQVEILVLREAEIERVIGFNFHRGALACAVRPRSANLADLCQRPGPTLIVACPEIHDPENLGAILRISAALGVTGVALGTGSCDPYMRRVLRVSMGAAFRVPIACCRDLGAELARLAEQFGLQTWATVTSPDALAFDDAKRPEKLAILLGSEGHGLSAQWQQFAVRRITIPMRPGTDSLNVAVSAGILLYHLTRSRESR